MSPVFFHLHPAETPSVSEEERYHISRFASIPGCYRFVVRHGFMDEVVSPDLGVLIYEQARKFVVHQVAAKSVEAGLRSQQKEQKAPIRRHHRSALTGREEKSRTFKVLLSQLSSHGLAFYPPNTSTYPLIVHFRRQKISHLTLVLPLQLMPLSFALFHRLFSPAASSILY